MFPTLRSEELPAGEGVDSRIRRVRAGDTFVLVARLGDGEVVAFDATCPHQVTELDDGTIVDGMISCPRHRYLYDTRSGRNVVPARDAKPGNLWKLRPGYLPCFPVEERDGWVWVDPCPRPPPEGYDPTLEERPARTRPGADPSADASVPAEPDVMIPGPPPLDMPTERSLKVVDVAPDSTVDLRLPIPPGQRQAWRMEMVGEALTVLDEEYEPGESPHQLVRLAALGPGACTLIFTYAYPDQPLPAAVRTYIVRVLSG